MMIKNPHRNNLKNQQANAHFFQSFGFYGYSIIIFSIIWLIAVVKIVFLEDHSSYNNTENFENTIQNLKSSGQVFTKKFQRDDEAHLSKVSSINDKVILPKSSDWIFLRSSNNYLIHSVLNTAPETNENVVVNHIPNGRKLLDWPPVDLDGKIPDEDGADYMKIDNLKVPRFWEPAEGQDVNKIGTKVNGEETIFLMIASYRDFQCRETITSAFSRADHPERLFVGAVDQVVPGDIGCLDIDVPCSEDPEQPICKYRNQISVFKMDAQYATGPVTARHIGDRMYRGQYFVMQMDAHCLFVNHWDKLIINQWRLTGNEMAVLSSYLSDVQESIDANGDSTRKSRPIMCNSDFEGAPPARYLRHAAQPEDVAVIRDMPQLQPFWAAGFSFSRGHFKYRVPYDGYQPMVFQGEEIAIGIRGFTYGYDFYAPRDSVVFHEYAVKSSRRSKVHMYWENNRHAGDGVRSIKRATAIIGMAPDLDPTSWDHTEEDKYGIGNVRSLSLFYKLFLIDPYARKSVQLCPFVRLGGMHRQFHPLLRSDGLGIDYSKLENFDTKKYLIPAAKETITDAESKLRSAIASKASWDLMNAIQLAERAGLDDENSALLKEAHAIKS